MSSSFGAGALVGHRAYAGRMAVIRETENEWDFDLAILALAAMLCVLGVGILYLAEREHAPEQSRMIVTGPPDFE